MPSSVNGVGSGTSAASATANALSGTKVSTDQFLKLLVMQLKNQDPLNPLSNEDFLTQLAQFQSLEETMQTAENTKNLLLGQQLAAASALIGKDVVVTGSDGADYVGNVEKVAVQDGKVLLIVGNTGVSLDEIKEIRLPATGE
ncbi:MAG TPA: flagellar hook capping FlgD N-terminal domain-containing protein [Planctomycetota bacterium]|nr:flagellar hook capping FlgD N-terminal domain-containing protein [Planctomycetota bacterium]